jgi:hypothetical protein
LTDARDRPPLAATHFDVSRIPETWKFSLRLSRSW